MVMSGVKWKIKSHPTATENQQRSSPSLFISGRPFLADVALSDLFIRTRKQNEKPATLETLKRNLIMRPLKIIYIFQKGKKCISHVILFIYFCSGKWLHGAFGTFRALSSFFNLKIIFLLRWYIFSTLYEQWYLINSTAMWNSEGGKKTLVLVHA